MASKHGPLSILFCKQKIFFVALDLRREDIYSLYFFQKKPFEGVKTKEVMHIPYLFADILPANYGSQLCVLGGSKAQTASTTFLSFLMQPAIAERNNSFVGVLRVVSFAGA